MDYEESRMGMQKIKIFVTHTPNKVSEKIDLPIFEHVLAGADFQNGETDLVKDNTGDNISAKNKSYCELTTQYWAWKNTDYDYYGFCHYRRYFAFCDKKIEESEWGTVEYPYINEKAIKELCINEKDIYDKVTKFDFLIAEGIDIKQLRAENVRDHYDKALELNVEDFDIMMRVIKEKYPDIYPSAVKYAEGKISYPCNMFIMNKQLFHQYSQFLFEVLEECEKQIDTTLYCVQSYRTIGHLAERLLGIYYIYLQEKGNNKLGELQIVLFKNTDAVEKVVPSCETAVPVVLAANDYYAPILCTCLESIREHINAEIQYDIVVFHTNISKHNQNKIGSIFGNNLNVRLQFINISSIVADYKLDAREHITTETFYRFLILDIMKDYDKVIYIDCDLVVNEDIAKLYQVEMGDNLIAGTLDADFIGQLNIPGATTLEYSREVLKLKDPYKYFQAGVLVFNVPEMRKRTTVKELLEIADQDLYRYSDQDILNVLCQGRVTYLDLRWNHIFDCYGERIKNVIVWDPVFLYEGYMEAKKDPYIIHYAGFCKPWDEPIEEFGEVFWNYARRTPYYELLIYRMSKHVADDAVSCNSKKHISLKSRIIYFFLPDGSPRRKKARAMWYKVFGKPEL